MASRFLLGSTIPKTCFFQHPYNPIQYLQLGTNEPAKTASSTTKWGIGLILEVDTVQLDAQDQHPPGFANTFFWPLKDDICGVPFQNIFCDITTPITVSGRSYSITVRFQYNYECLC